MTRAGNGEHHSRCNAKTKTGKRCGRPAGWGTDHVGAGCCKLHGGATPMQRKAAHVQIVEREARRQLEANGYDAIVDPVSELLKLGAEVTAFKDVLRERVTELESWTHRDAKDTEDVKALLAAYERALDRVDRTLTGMLKLDLEARMVRLAEREGETLARVIRLVMADVGLPENPEVGEIVRRRFAEVRA